MKMKMMKLSLWLLLLGLALTSAAGPGSCVGRCGEVFTRGQKCTCDFSCLQHNECCPDFEATCTTALSCQGRCGETFRRGRPCDCDLHCKDHNTCCHDYRLHCDTSVSVSGSNPGTLQPPRAPASDVTNISVSLLPSSSPSSHSGNPDSSVPISALSSHSVPSQDSWAPVSSSGPTGPLVLTPGDVAQYGFSQGVAGFRPRPSTTQDVDEALGLSVMDSEGPGAGQFADVDLCSDSPISGLTALSNGTILIFKGELFWSVDPVSHIVGRPQNITDMLGVPAPIDTVFTRCNCHRNTYIIKGDQCWRLDGNMVVEPGFPKPVASEFPGVTGIISAALAVPASRRRPETVFFFKSGDRMQGFTFPPCSTRHSSSLQRFLTRQAVSASAEINIKVSLKGFPTPVTSALSVPSPLRSDTFYHYVFSGPLFFNVHIIGDLPALAKPDRAAPHAPLPIRSPVAIATNVANVANHHANPIYPTHSIRYWLRCP